MKGATKFVIAAAALAARSAFDVGDSYAAGEAPWCAVISVGEGEVFWDCQYRTVEECVPNVIAGNRGFCNLNPHGPVASPPAAVSKRHFRRHAGG